MSRVLFQGQQVGIEKSKGVRRFDDSDSSSALLFLDPIAERLHSCPMHLRSEMVLRVIAVKEPNPIVKFVVTAHAPGKRFVRVAAIVAVVAIEVGKAMAKVPERHQKTDVAPVENAENDERRNEQR